MGWLLKRQCPPFSVLNRCALIGRIYLSLVAYSGQVALPPTDCLGLWLFWAFCPRASGQDSPLTATKGREETHKLIVFIGGTGMLAPLD